MKTAISVDDGLLQEADRAARKIGVSRSRLVSLALTDYLRRRRQEEVIEQLNRVYAEEISGEDRRVVAGVKAKLRKVKERW